MDTDRRLYCVQRRLPPTHPVRSELCFTGGSFSHRQLSGGKEVSIEANWLETTPHSTQVSKLSQAVKALTDPWDTKGCGASFPGAQPAACVQSFCRGTLRAR